MDKPFTPPKLPPNLDYNQLVTLIGKANASVARLDGLIDNLQNPSILTTPFLTREAVSSSTIEGTQATVDEVLEYEAREETREDDSKSRDIVEILNYRRSISDGIRLLDSRPLNENLIKDLHSTLMRSARGGHRSPGDFRIHQVHIGPPGSDISEASYIPPEPQKIVELFADLEVYLNSDEVIDQIVQIAVGHYQFEAIHPFSDGNGRLGRLLIPLFLYYKGILSYPLLYVSEFFELHRDEYYARLKNVSEKGEWNEWIEFFLRAIDTQAQQAQVQVKAVLGLYKYHSETTALRLHSPYASSIIDFLFRNPKFTPNLVAKESPIRNRQTALNIIQKLVEMGVVSPTKPSRQRNQVYQFNDLMELLNR